MLSITDHTSSWTDDIISLLDLRLLQEYELVVGDG